MADYPNLEKLWARLTVDERIALHTLVDTLTNGNRIGEDKNVAANSVAINRSLMNINTSVDAMRPEACKFLEENLGPKDAKKDFSVLYQFLVNMFGPM